MEAMSASGEALEIWAAAELLGLTIQEVYDLVFSLQLPTIEAPNGRRLVPRSAVEAYKSGKTSVSA